MYAQDFNFRTRTLQNRHFAQFDRVFQIIYVLIGISLHNSAQNVIKLNSDQAEKFTFRKSGISKLVEKNILCLSRTVPKTGCSFVQVLCVKLLYTGSSKEYCKNKQKNTKRINK